MIIRISDHHNNDTAQVVHDVHMDAAALSQQHNIQLRGVFDTQLAYELVEQDMWSGMAKVRITG